MIYLLSQLRELVLSKTAKDTSVVFLGNAVSSILGILFTILAARYLGPENWGVVAAVISFIAILTAFGDLGLTSGLFRFISKLWSKGKKARATQFKSAIFSLRLMTAAAFMGVLLILSPQISIIFFKTNEPLLAVLGGIGLFGLLLIDFQISSLQSKLRWKTASVFIASTNVFRLLFLLVLFWARALNISSVLLVFFSSSVLSFLLSLFWERSTPSLGRNWKKIFQKIVGFSSWMGLNRIASAAASRIDVLLLLQLATSFEAGIFAVARQLGNGIPIIIGSFATVLAPRFASYEGDDLKSFFRKAIFLSSIISFGIILGIFVAEPVISLFGPKYIDSILVFKWFLVALIPFALATPAVNALIYSFHKPKIIALTTTFQLPLVFLGYIYAIPRFGVFGPVVVIGLWNLSTLVVSYSFALYFFRKAR